MNTIWALVKKDLLLIWKCGAKVIILLFALYIVIPLFSGADESTLALGSMLCVLCTAMQVSSFTLDETAHWNRYALSAPVTRRQLVWSKYATAFTLSCIGEALLAVYILLICLMGVKEMLRMLPEALLTGMLVSVLFFSLLLPMIFRFGVERARIIFVALCAAAGVGMGVLQITMLPGAGGAAWAAGIVPAASAAAVLVLAAVSVRISLAVFSKKEIE